MTTLNYRKFNNYNLEDDYDNIVQFKSNNKIPDDLSDAQTKRFIRKYKPFHAKDDRLYYKTFEVIRKQNIDSTLQPIYDDITKGFGHGITHFYYIVANKYLNITRKDVTIFLKKQTNYQLTFQPKKRTQQVKKYNKEGEAYALDLIDIHRYEKSNNKYQYILTMIDVYSQKVWLRALKHKTAEDINKVLTPIFNEHTPKYILMDNGTEFKGINTDMFKDLGIKRIFTPSHTPQPNIEQLNGQVRKMLSKLFVMNKNLHWFSYLKDIELNMNNFFGLKRNVNKREKKAEARKEMPAEIVKPKYASNDIVRISQKAFEPSVREQNKKGLQKYQHVKYSVNLFKIYKIYKPYKSNAFPYYTLKNTWENEIIYNNDTPMRFKEEDLLLVPNNTIGDEMTQKQNDILNGIKGYEFEEPVIEKRITRSKK